MYAKLRIGIITGLILLALTFSYFHFSRNDENTDSSSKDYHKIRVEENKFETIMCEGSKHYAFRNDGDYLLLVINGKSYKVESPMSIRFEQDTNIGIGCEANKGLVGKAGYVEIFKNRGSKNELIYLDTKNYSREIAVIDKGYIEDVKFQEEPFIMGLFQGDKLIKEIIIGPGKRDNYRAWGRESVRFKAGDIPMLVKIDGLNRFYKEKLVLAAPNFAFGHWHKTDMGDAYYLEPGEVIKTPVYMVAGEKIEMKDRSVKKIKLKIGENDQWKKSQTDYINLKANYPGYLYIWAVERVVITWINCKRIEKRLEMRHGQVEEISVEAGDVVMTRGNENYYVNNELQPENKNNFHEINKNGILAIKPGVVANKIYIDMRFAKRRGY